MRSKSVTTHVPATTANLGPGFDCLALALDIWNHATFTLEGEGIHLKISGEGSGQLIEDKRNLIAKSVIKFFRFFNFSEPIGLQIRCENNIPLGSGLGSSAAAVVTGLLGANALLGHIASPDDLLDLATDIEGHPDNVTAALFGGLSIVIKEGEHFIHHKVDIPELEVAVAVPKFELPTQVARSALPKAVPLSDVIYNLGRTALVVEGLRTNNLTLIQSALKDRIHQPYRIKLLPGASEAMKAAIENGATAVALSGAGPSVIAFTEKETKKIAEIMVNAYKCEEITARPYTLSTIVNGAYVD